MPTSARSPRVVYADESGNTGDATRPVDDDQPGFCLAAIMEGEEGEFISRNGPS